MTNTCTQCKPWDDGACDFGCPCDDCGGPDTRPTPGSLPGSCWNCYEYLKQSGAHATANGWTCKRRICVCAVGFINPTCEVHAA